MAIPAGGSTPSAGRPPRSPTTSTRPERRAQLLAGLDALVPEVEGLRGAREALALLLADHDLAWQAYATSLLAEALADD